MRWNGIALNVYFLDKEYERGMRLTARELLPYSKRLIRTPMIDRWSLVIKPLKLAG